MSDKNDRFAELVSQMMPPDESAKWLRHWRMQRIHMESLRKRLRDADSANQKGG